MATPAGYLAAAPPARLLVAAGSAVILLRAGIGDTLPEGVPVADLHGGEVADEAVLRGLVTGW